jgi:hypothetical protein
MSALAWTFTPGRGIAIFSRAEFDSPRRKW